MHGWASFFNPTMGMMLANPAPMGTIMNSTVALHKLVTLFIVIMPISRFVVFNMKLFFFFFLNYNINPPLNFKNVIMSSIGTHKNYFGTHIRQKELIKKIRTHYDYK